MCPKDHETVPTSVIANVEIDLDSSHALIGFAQRQQMHLDSTIIEADIRPAQKLVVSLLSAQS